MLECFHCHGAIKERPELAGQAIACPHCGQEVVMPPAAPTILLQRTRAMYQAVVLNLLLTLLVLLWLAYTEYRVRSAMNAMFEAMVRSRLGP